MWRRVALNHEGGTVSFHRMQHIPAGTIKVRVSMLAFLTPPLRNIHKPHNIGCRVCQETTRTICSRVITRLAHELNQNCESQVLAEDRTTKHGLREGLQLILYILESLGHRSVRHRRIWHSITKWRWHRVARSVNMADHPSHFSLGFFWEKPSSCKTLDPIVTG